MITSVRCEAPFHCPSRTADNLCTREVVVLTSFDAHCAHGEELRFKRHELRIKEVRAQEAKGAMVLDIYKVQDPDRDIDEGAEL